MKTLTSVILLLLSVPFGLRASHIYGGDLYYKHLSGNDYEITMGLYGDCQGSAFPGLYSFSPIIRIEKGGVFLQDISLQLNNSPNVLKEITPVCSAYQDSTQCKSLTSLIPGVTQFVYSGVVTLPGQDEYKFIFAGTSSTGSSSAGRTASITNIVLGSASSLLYLVATLDNSLNNSSPTFTTLPTPFYCINNAQEFNQGVIDVDGDSLNFELTSALDGSGSPANYLPGYSATHPLDVSGPFLFNSTNGQMSFTPSSVQRSLVVNKVTEYRGGQPVGSVMREMSFIVLGDCMNRPAEASLTLNSTSGGIWAPEGNILNICKGTPLVTFDLDVTDPDGDSVDVTVRGISNGVTIADNGSEHVSVQVSFNTATLSPGNYNFFLTLTDRHCPLNVSQTVGYTLRIVEPYSADRELILPTDCYHPAVMQFSFADGVLPRQVSISQNGNIIRSFEDTSGQWVDSLRAGDYVLTLSSPYLGCALTYPFSIADSGTFPLLPYVSDSVFCFSADTRPIEVITYPGAVAHWFDENGNALPDAPLVNTSVFHPQVWYVSQQYDVCESGRQRVEIRVRPKPDIRIFFDTGIVCIGEQVFLRASGADQIAWLPEDQISFEPDGTPYTRIINPTTLVAIGTNQTGCRDTVNITFHSVERCCTFSFPSAFTPNSDGRNDTWRPVLYGNMRNYELSIYNRWGTRVFHSFIPGEGWDGFYEKQPQDIGTYYYLMQAKCFTEKEESQSGSFMLLR